MKSIHFFNESEFIDSAFVYNFDFKSNIFLKFSNFVSQSPKFQNSANIVPTLPLKSVTLCLARPSFRRSFLTSSQRNVLLCHPFVNSPLFCLFQIDNIYAVHTNSKHWMQSTNGRGQYSTTTLNFIHVSQFK